ncbi:MAG: flavodoxin family protein [Chlorobium sp.]|nr:MAG: flavodoxin family protein [Chlorobium sp.]
METPVNILAIVGSYRKTGIIERAVDEILASAKERGAVTRKIILLDKHLAFCTNCRSCTQVAGENFGICIHDDDMGALLKEIEWADALVLASPMNAGTVTAIMKIFIERLVCTAYWPWGAPAPKARRPGKSKRAVLVASSAAPAFLARLTGDVTKRLKSAATMLGAETVGTLFIGLAAQQQHQELSKRTVNKAHKLGHKLAVGKSAREN